MGSEPLEFRESCDVGQEVGWDLVEVELRRDGKLAPPGSEERVQASEAVRRVLSRAAVDLGQPVHAVLSSGEVVSLPPVAFSHADDAPPDDPLASRAERLARLVDALRGVGALEAPPPEDATD